MGVSFARASAESRTRPKGGEASRWPKSMPLQPAIPPLLFRGFGCGGALLGIGNKGFEARIALEELQTGVLFHAECCGWQEPVVECLAQKRKCLRAISPVRCDNTKVINTRSRLRMFWPKNTAGDVQFF